MENNSHFKILIVDDRLENLIALSAILRKEGFKSETALSGSEALKLLLKNKYGLIILDVQMPEMNGFELAELIKGNSKTKDIPLIFLSANASDKEFSLKGIEVGALDYLAKPVDETLLILKVNNFRKMHQASEDLEETKKTLEKKAILAQISYEDLYFSLPQEVFIINKEGLIISINRFDTLFCGLKANELLNRHFSISPFLNEILGENNGNAILRYFTEDSKLKKNIEFKIERIDKTIFYGHSVITSAIIEGKFHIQVSIYNETENKKQELFLKQINDSVAVKTGASYFSEFTKFCCEELGVKYALVGNYIKEQHSIETISFRNGNNELPIYKYNLNNTPCSLVLNGEACVYPKNVQLLFPNDEDLKTFGIESYLGMPLIDENKNPLGIIVLLDDKPMEDVLQKEKLISFLAPRATNELISARANSKLKKSEERFRTLFEQNLAGVYRANLDDIITECNDSFAQIIGFNAANEVIGKHVRDLYENISHPNFNEKLREFNGKLTLEEVVIKKKNGENVFLLENASFIYNKFGSEKYLEGTIINITERKKIEEKINESEKRYRGLFEMMTDGLLYSDPNNIILMVNSSFCEMVEYTREELVGQNGYYLLHDDIIRSQLVKKLSERKEGKSEQYELEFIAKSGKRMQTKINASPSYDSNGNFTGVSSLISNITEQKLYEKKLLFSKEKFESVVNNINDGLFQIDLKGKVTYYNQKFLDIFGLSVSSMDNLSIESFTAKEYHQELFERHFTRIAGGEVDEIIHYEGIHKNGHRIWIESKIKLLKENNIIIGTQSILRDITERKKQEGQLNKTVKELNNRNNELMQFNYIVSHNLRSPIANLIGLSTLLNIPNIKEDEKSKILEYIHQSALKMDDQIKDLNVVLATRSALNEIKEKVSFPLLIRSICNTFSGQIRESEIVIKTNIQDDASEIFSIKSYLESILYNLISNAIKYKSNSRTPELMIDISRQKDFFVIKMIDNGIGIDLNLYGDYVFGLYKRFNLEIEGKGLGLHMTKNQVEALGGSINVESALDKGTIFSITLPV